MKTLRQWLILHSPSAQAAASLWVFVTILWSTNDAFKDYIFGIYAALPHSLHNLIAGIVIPALILWRTQRKTVVMAEASPGKSGTASASATTGNLVPVLLLAALALATVGLTGCTNFERDTFNSLSASKAVIDQVGMDYNSGAIDRSAANFAAIMAARNAQSVAVNGLLTYESLKNSGASSAALSARESQVLSDVAALEQLIAAIKALKAPATPAATTPTSPVKDDVPPPMLVIPGNYERLALRRAA